jgi:tRNA (guanine37-N1)-methyltransferase
MEFDPNFRSQFSRSITVPSLSIPVSDLNSILSSHKAILLNLPKVQVVLATSDPSHKLLLLSPAIPIPPDLLHFPQSEHTIVLTYDNFSYTDVLKQLLPPDISIPTGFETVGHIAHFNLSADQFPFKNLIGQVLLDVIRTQKLPKIKTVVTKIGKIENVFRTFRMEVIAGEPLFLATVVT